MHYAIVWLNIRISFTYKYVCKDIRWATCKIAWNEQRTYVFEIVWYNTK